MRVEGAHAGALHFFNVKPPWVSHFLAGDTCTSITKKMGGPFVPVRTRCPEGVGSFASLLSLISVFPLQSILKLKAELLESKGPPRSSFLFILERSENPDSESLWREKRSRETDKTPLRLINSTGEGRI